MRLTTVVLFLLLAPCVFGQTVTVGTLPAPGTTTIGDASFPVTFIDLTLPATAAGSLTTAALRWNIGSIPGCANAFKIKFFRPVVGAMTLVAERGPFNGPASSGLTLVTLSPPVTIAKYDVIGVTQMQSLITCGSVVFTDDVPSKRFFFIKKDAQSESLAAGGLYFGVLNAMASSASEVLVGIVPAVGSLQGNGNFFRTSMQLTNPDSATISGKLVYHPAGRSALPGDQALPYTIGPYKTVSYTDIVTFMGQSGLGSLDVISTYGPAPIVTARVFADGGAAGTAGFNEATFTPEQAMPTYSQGTLSMPADPVNFRVNIGVRTLSAGATIYVKYYDAGGNFLSAFSKTYAKDYFEQVSVAAFLGGIQPTNDSLIYVSISAGSAIIYASTTDSRTGDSAAQFAGR